MAVSALREIMIGVQDLPARTAQFETGCGLSVLTSGALTSMTSNRLFDTHLPPRATVVGRRDVPGSPRIRMVETGAGRPARAGGVDTAGPIGIGFTTKGITDVHARLGQADIHFLSPPIPFAPLRTESDPVPPGPQRLEAIGRSMDGDFIVLSERLHPTAPYGTFRTDVSEPLHASFTVTNLSACEHFMRDVLEHETLLSERCSGSPFDSLLGLSKEVAFGFVMSHRPGWPTGRLVFMEFERKLQPMTQVPALARGLCRLRYDTTDLHATLSRVPGGGGSLVRGPASVDDAVLGSGLVATVRAPFGVLIEIWQTQ